MRAEIGELETQARRLLLHDAKPAETKDEESSSLPRIQGERTSSKPTMK
jgi:hypothetical protein